jgi:hypothetical protein
MPLAVDGRKKDAKSLARYRNFLESLANLPDQQKIVDRFEREFADLLPQTSWLLPQVIAKVEAITGSQQTEQQISTWRRQCETLPLRDRIRAIWDSPDPRTKRWKVFRLLEMLWMRSHPRFIFSDEPPLPESNLEHAVELLLKWSELTKHCAHTQCPNPYFLGSRGTRKYCNEACAYQGQLASARKWWTKEGKKWREERRAKKGAKRK